MCHVITYKHIYLYLSPFVKFTESEKRNNLHLGACAYKRGNTVMLIMHYPKLHIDIGILKRL